MLQKIAPAPHLMPLGMAPYSFAQYDLAGHTDSTPTSPRNVPISSHAGAPRAASDSTAGAATGAEAVVELASTCTVRCGAAPPDPDPEDPGLFLWCCC